MEQILTFKDVADRLESGHAKLHERMPYFNRRSLEGTTIGFYHFCEWFEVNIHNSHNLSPENAALLLKASPETRLDSSEADENGLERWFGGAWANGHYVSVWYNPQAF